MRRSPKVELIDAGLLSGWLVAKRLHMAREHLSGEVLDFACGHGQLAQLFEPARYLGYDSDSRRIDVARRHFPGYRFETTLPVGTRFDTVVALAFIEHVQPEAYLKQFADLLKPNGRIVLTTPHPSYEWIHTAGARLHIFSPEAHDEHEGLISRARMAELTALLDLRLVTAQRFLLGANQLFVLDRAA